MAMYEAHPVFIQPENPEVKVWRYMDFTKLISLIDSRRLFFTRADKFNDPFEGSWPKMNVAARQKVYEQMQGQLSETARAPFLKAMKNFDEINKHWRRFHAINCWHMNEHESAAMWKLYLKSDEGIAVQSTYSRLRTSLIDGEKVFLGMVNYVDYDRDMLDGMMNTFTPFVHKRKSFEYEREVRAVIAKYPVSAKGIVFDEETITDGIKIKVDIEELIDKIYIAPSAPSWFAELVSGLVRRYGYEFGVVQSRLDDQPVF
jgi:hypothetical protein